MCKPKNNIYSQFIVGNNSLMELPKKDKRQRLVDVVGIKMTRDMKCRLEELSEFHDVDVPKWLRSLIQRGLEDIDASRNNDRSDLR